ncbi:MAG TPA: A24 family peptidase [Methylococcaceae bacterium]|nr:A24 family peptidase [Methylococcaceae bacterium]
MLTQLGEVLRAEHGVLLVLAALLGLMIGSFINVLIHRLPLMMERQWKRECHEFLSMEAPVEEDNLNLLTPRSRCPQCLQTIRAWENIPILSFLLQKGRCRHCGAAISFRYPLVEALTAMVTVAVVWRFGWSVPALFALPFSWTLLGLAFIDFDRQLLPDSMTQPLLWTGLLLNGQSVYVDGPSSVYGAVAGYLTLWLIYHLFRLATGKEGMGYGDFKLLAALGAWLGWQKLPLIVLLSSLTGAVLGLTLIGLGLRSREQPMPFGPYLAIAGWIALLWGDSLIAAWMG